MPRAAVKAGKLHILYTKLNIELEFVRERIRKYYNNKRLEGPSLGEGDKVFLLTRNLRIKRPSKKLDYRKVGPLRGREEGVRDSVHAEAT